MSKIWKPFLNVLEYFIGLEFIYGGINTLFADPFPTPNIFYALLAGQAAIYVYSVLFFALGVLLIYAKIAHKRRTHGRALGLMYLTCVYVIALSIALMGLHWGLVNAVITALVCGLLWLRWRLFTEYITPKDFAEDCTKLRMGDPPSGY